MKKKLPILILLVGLVSYFSLSSTAQLVGPYRCEDEHVQANLRIKYAVEVRGTVLDESGAIFSRITLQLQKPDNSIVLMSATVDNKGKFDFGTVPSGTYRLVPAKVANSQIARVPGFDPPRALTCSNDTVCELRVVLPVRGTDRPYEDCPPR